MSTDAFEESHSVLVDAPAKRSPVLPLVVGAGLLTVLLGAQLGVAAARVDGSTTALPAAQVVDAPSSGPTAEPAPTASVAPSAPASVPAAPAPPAPPAALSDPRAVALQEALDAAGDVTFDPVTGEPSESRSAVLNAVAAAVLEAGDLPIAVVGHSEPSDSPEAEQSIGLQRAEEVALSLRLRMVPPALLVTDSVGAAQVAEGDGEAGNRRVSFRVLPPG